jgi:hypothetical protein
MAGDVSINVSQELIKPIIDAKIQAAIVAELQKDQNLIPKMIQAALNLKVDSEGRRRNDSYYDKYPYIEVLCNQAIQEAARHAMKDYLAENKEALKEAVKKQLEKQKDTLAAAFVDGLIKNTAIDYHVKFDVNFSKFRD